MNNLNRFLKKLPTIVTGWSEQRGLRKLSKEVGTSIATLSRVANGRKPSVDVFIKLYEFAKRSKGDE